MYRNCGPNIFETDCVKKGLNVLSRERQKEREKKEAERKRGGEREMKHREGKRGGGRAC